MDKYKFEEITDKYVKKQKRAVGGWEGERRRGRPAKKVEDIKCPQCGESFVLKINGPRSGGGKCECGYFIML